MGAKDRDEEGEAAERVVRLVVPVGTQVVTRRSVMGQGGRMLCVAGAVGEVIAIPEEAMAPYRIRLADGVVVVLKRPDFTIRKHHQRTDLERQREAMTPRLWRYVIYRCVVGSRAYGLEREGSDTDRRGFYLPPAELHWALCGLPGQLENSVTDECYWELQKFVTLALKANPNILECLYTPLVEEASPLAEELRAMRSAFLSKRVYQTYGGYVMSQFKKLEQDLRTKGELRWKHACHLLRLLLSGITILEKGDVPVHVGEHRERLLEIRDGRVAWDEINAWRLVLHKRFDGAYVSTTLPEGPDFEAVSDFVLRARRSMVDAGEGRGP